VDVRFALEQDSGTWVNVLEGASYIPVDYAQFFVDYQCEYLTQTAHVYDLRLIIYHDRKPVGVWPVVLIADFLTSRVMRFGSNAGPLLGPLFVNDVSSALRQK